MRDGPPAHEGLVSKRPRHKESFEETLKYLTQEGMKIKPIDIEYPEYRGTIEEIVTEGARECSNILQSEVIIFRIGLLIDSLNGFPGFATGYVLKSIGIEGILKLMEDTKNRGAEWIFCIGYSRPGIEPKIFKGVCRGDISLKPKGNKGYAFDPIFILGGYNKTFAEEPTLKDKVGARIIAIKKFVRWYKSRKEVI